MVSLDPSARPTFSTLLSSSRGTVFPESFYSFLYDYIASVNELSTTSLFKTGLPSSNNGVGTGTTTSSTSGVPESVPGIADQTPLPNDSDHRLEKIWNDYSMIERHFHEDASGVEVEPDAQEEGLDESRATLKPQTRRQKRLDSIFPVELYIPGFETGDRMEGQCAAAEGALRPLHSSFPILLHALPYTIRSLPLTPKLTVVSLPRWPTPPPPPSHPLLPPHRHLSIFQTPRT